MEVPKHVGIIMDGNRRWSRENDKSKLKGHLEGERRAEEILQKAFNMGIKALSLYTFSSANYKSRPKKEKKYLFKMFAKTFRRWAEKEFIHNNHVRIMVSGRWRKLPKYVQKAIDKAREATEEYTEHYLNLCIVYDGRDEIVDAVKDIMKKVKEKTLKIKDITRETIRKHLYYDLPNPELIIRTGMKKARRLSGFLLWGSAYAEFKFRSTYWPDYTPELLEKDIKEWSQRRKSSHGE